MVIAKLLLTVIKYIQMMFQVKHFFDRKVYIKS